MGQAPYTEIDIGLSAALLNKQKFVYSLCKRTLHIFNQALLEIPHGMNFAVNISKKHENLYSFSCSLERIFNKHRKIGNNFFRNGVLHNETHEG